LFTVDDAPLDFDEQRLLDGTQDRRKGAQDDTQRVCRTYDPKRHVPCAINVHATTRRTALDDALVWNLVEEQQSNRAYDEPNGVRQAQFDAEPANVVRYASVLVTFGP
jgi:hypothetical protein